MKFQHFISLCCIVSLVVCSQCVAQQSTTSASQQKPLVAKETKLDFEATLTKHVEHLATTIGERNLNHYEELCEAADYIEAEFKNYGLTPTLQTFKVKGLDCHNIAAEIKGSTKPEEILIIGGHYDSAQGTPGANDNGSGTAAMLALAQHFSKSKPDRTLRFVAFTNEEPPYFQTRDEMGSWVYAEMCRLEDQNIVGVISLETMGYFTDAKDSQHYPSPLDRMYPSTGNFIGLVGDIKSGRMMRKVLKSFKENSEVPVEGASLPGAIPGVGWSDHWSFWQEGYVGIMVTDTAPYRYPHYHKATDTPDKINFPVFAKVAEGLVRPIEELVTEPGSNTKLQESKPNQPASKEDPTRAKKLFVSTDPADHPQRDHEADVERNRKSDEKLFAAAEGKLDLTKITIPSQVDDLQIPAYLFQPLEKRKRNGHPALVWVYGGVHDFFGTNYFPFIQEAVEQGYVVIAPEYRGASGYGKEFYDSIDYGGYEVNDILAASDYLKLELPHVDPSRIGVIGWSHGGFISLLAATREKNDFACAVAFVPVTNLVFRLSYKGPEYQRMFATQTRIGGLPFEKPELYLDRSPLYHVSKLKTPLLVQVATNDDDVDFVEAEMLVNALKVKQPKLAEVIVYDEPTGGHFFNRQVNLETLVREDTPVQVDSWARTWKFLNLNLKPGQE